MIASKSLRRTCTVVALLGLCLSASTVIAFSYTWAGGSSGSWNGSYVWNRSGCSPCDEYPDDTGDDATIDSAVSLLDIDETIDDLSITDADVRIGRQGTGICTSPDVLTYLTVDSVTITATSGNTAQMRGGSCQTVSTN